jgi:hypothetical protein
MARSEDNLLVVFWGRQGRASTATEYATRSKVTQRHQGLTRNGWNFSVIFCGIIPSNPLACWAALFPLVIALGQELRPIFAA